MYFWDKKNPCLDALEHGKINNQTIDTYGGSNMSCKCFLKAIKLIIFVLTLDN